LEKELPALIPAFCAMEKENILESSGCSMRIHQSSPGCIPKRWERFTFSLGEKAGGGRAKNHYSGVPQRGYGIL
jgi:hypothetical protein